MCTFCCELDSLLILKDFSDKVDGDINKNEFLTLYTQMWTNTFPMANAEYYKITYK